MRLAITGNQIIDLIKKSQRVLVLLGTQPKADEVAAALAWRETILGMGQGADVVCLGELPVAVANLENASAIKNRLDPTNLVISFNWAQSMIEKVSYSVEGEKFNLIITPAGKRLDPTKVDYSYRGSDYNLIIALGLGDPNQLPENLFDKNLFEGCPTINVDNKSENPNFGKINVVDPEADSVAGLVSEILKESGLVFSAKVADYLLFGVRSATANFENVKDPASFEQAAFLTKIKKEAASQPTQKQENQAPGNEDWFSPKVMRSSKVS